MDIAVVSIFTQMFQAITDYGVVGRAIDRGILNLNLIDPRDFSEDYRKGRVDDRPYGGGPGMVMESKPLVDAVEAAKGKLKPNAKVIYLSPQGKRVDQGIIQGLAGQDVVFIAGRYEGIDERVIEHCVDEQWSIGDYVLSGGELAAMVVIDAVARWLPGTLGDENSVIEESFMDGLLDCPHYTRPQEFLGRKVPNVLISGDHKQVELWRRKQRLGRTYLRRKDLIDLGHLNEQDRILLEEYLETIGDEQ